MTTLRFTRRAGEPDLVATLGSRSETEAYAHRVELVVSASIAELGGYAPWTVLEAIDPQTTRMVSGTDDADAAAAWLLRMPEDITVVGDAAVLQSIERLRERLRRMTASA